MGVCSSKEKNDSLSISSYFKGSTKNNNINTQKSDFFNFTEWILGFQFYIKLQNDNGRITKLITKHLGSNEKNIFKVIKAIDQLEGKEFHEFTNSLSLQSSKRSNNTKFYSNNNNININRTGINLNDNMKNSENSNIKVINNNDLRLILSNFIDRLCTNKIKKIQKILLIGPPNNIRWLIWLSIAKNKFFEIESLTGVNNSQIYNNLINYSPNPEIDKQIREDLKNTLPNIKYFKNQNWLNSLYNILKVFSIYDKKIGYKKGMNDIVGNILIVSDCNEVESFQFLRYLFSNYYGLAIREFFKDDSIRFNFYSFLINELIRERIFPIYEIISKLQIEKEMWLDKWIITLYGILFDFSINIRLFDCMIALGLNFLINYTLGLLKYYQNVIVQFKDRNSFLNFFERKLKFKTDNDIFIYRERIVKLALEFNISHATIKRIEDKFNLEMKMKNTNNMIYKHFQYSRFSVKNNNKENNHEVDIMKSIRRSIYGSKENFELDKNDINIEDENNLNNKIKNNNNNINGNKNIIKNNIKNNINSNINSNIKNSFINNESKNDSESENSDNVINTNKKKDFNESFDDNEEDNQIKLRKDFPNIKNNYFNVKTYRENIRYNNNKNKKGNEEIKNGNESYDDIKKEDIKEEENKKVENKEEENKKEDIIYDDNKKVENKEEENKKEDIIYDDNKKEDNKEEEIKKEDIINDDNKKEDNKEEEIKKEDTINDDIKKEENKIEEIKKVDIKIEENKLEENKKENNEDDDDESVIPIDNLDDDEDINISIEDENKPKKLKNLYQPNT